MIHFLFNNIFLEGQHKDADPNNYSFPINNENDHVLLYLLDIYDKVKYRNIVPTSFLSD